MGRMKDLHIQLQQNAMTNKHNLDEAHWQACAKMVEELQYEELKTKKNGSKKSRVF